MKSRLSIALLALAILSLGVYSAPTVIIKKIIPKAEFVQENPAPLEVIYVTNDFSQSPPKETKLIEYIHSSMIPDSISYWRYNGSDLRSHISITHGIEYGRMKYLNRNDLIKLHSYLHNGGSL